MAERIAVQVVCAEPGRVQVIDLEVPAGSTAMNALERSRLLDDFPDYSPLTWRLGIFGRVCEAGQILHPGDRVELYRPLTNDPKVRRRDRAAAGKLVP